MSIRNIFWNPNQHRLRALWRLILQAVIWLLLVLLLQLIADAGLNALTGGLGDASVATRQLTGPLSQAIALAAVLLSVWLAGRYLDKRPFAGFGLHLGRDWWIDFAFGLALGLLLMTLIFLVELVTGWGEVVAVLYTREGGLPFLPGILLPLLTFILVGINEEVWTRGYMLTNLAEGLNWRWIGPVGAIVLATLVQATIFGLGHALNPNSTAVSTVNLVLAGVFLAIGYLLTGELAVPIGLHISWNFAQGNLFGYEVSGTPVRVATLLDMEQTGPALWTGGAFGPEAGLLGIGAMILGSVLIFLWVRLRYGRARLVYSIAEHSDGPRQEPA